MIRHGARAPGNPDTKGYFEVAPGMLTSSGMRQRYLQGKFNHERYVEEYGMLDRDFNPNQLYV